VDGEALVQALSEDSFYLCCLGVELVLVGLALKRQPCLHTPASEASELILTATKGNLQESAIPASFHVFANILYTFSSASQTMSLP
jgi:hypothetical protein